MLETLVRNPAFYAAAWALINAVVAVVWPDMPESIRAAANAFAAVIFGTITGGAAVQRKIDTEVQRQLTMRNAYEVTTPPTDSRD